MGKEYIAEFGSIGGVRFLQPGQANIYDSEGNAILCECGNPAAHIFIGKEAYLARCTECMYYKEMSDEV